MTRSREHRKIARKIKVYGVAAYIFRPRAGINTHPRHFLGRNAAVILYSRGTAGQSTSALAIIQGSLSAAARHSAHAGSAITACL